MTPSEDADTCLTDFFSASAMDLNPVTLGWRKVGIVSPQPISSREEKKWHRKIFPMPQSQTGKAHP
jgi:hypothetical protein